MRMSIKDNKSKKASRIIESFNHSIDGIIETIRSESHMRFHIFTAIIIIILAMLFDVTKAELLILILTVSLVFITEIINTSIERTVDLVTEKKNPLAKIAKDSAAGAVMIAAISSLLVGYIIFFDRILKFVVTTHHIATLTGRISNISLLVIALLCIIVVSVKAIYKKGTALEGGMPSGHATLASSFVVIITFMTTDIRVILMALVLCLLVCQSRIKAGIHTFKEVLVGSIIGFSVTYIIFLVLIKLGRIF